MSVQFCKQKSETILGKPFYHPMGKLTVTPRSEVVKRPDQALTVPSGEVWAWPGDPRYVVVAKTLHRVGIEPAEFGNNGLTFSLGENVQPEVGAREVGGPRHFYGRYQIESAIYEARSVGQPAYGPAYTNPRTFAGIFFLTLKDCLAARKLALPTAALLLGAHTVQVGGWVGID